MGRRVGHPVVFAGVPAERQPPHDLTDALPHTFAVRSSTEVIAHPRSNRAGRLVLVCALVFPFGFLAFAVGGVYATPVLLSVALLLLVVRASSPAPGRSGAPVPVVVGVAAVAVGVAAIPWTGVDTAVTWAIAAVLPAVVAVGLFPYRLPPGLFVAAAALLVAASLGTRSSSVPRSGPSGCGSSPGGVRAPRRAGRGGGAAGVGQRVPSPACRAVPASGTRLRDGRALAGQPVAASPQRAGGGPLWRYAP